MGMEEYFITDVEPDAKLAEIKAKNAECISKLKKVLYDYVRVSKELTDAKRQLIEHEDTIRDDMTAENHARGSGKLTKDEMTVRVKRMVKTREGMANIYDDVERLEGSKANLDKMIRINDKIGDRINDMLVAETTMMKHQKGAS